jgi:hypothetical protein
MPLLPDPRQTASAISAANRAERARPSAPTNFPRGERVPTIRPFLSPDNARRLLLDLRENGVKLAFPAADPARGLLRKSMLDELIRKRPTTAEEFRLKSDSILGSALTENSF